MFKRTYKYTQETSCHIYTCIPLAKTPPKSICDRYNPDSMNMVNTLNNSDENFNGIKYGLASEITIFIADSDADFSRYLCKCLSSLYSVKCFSNGLQAWDRILNESVDLLICATGLAGIEGDELSSRVKTSLKIFPIPVILLDSLPDTNFRQRRRYSSADIYMPKSLSIDNVKTEIEVLLSNSLLVRKHLLAQVLGENFSKECLNKDRQFINEVRNFILEHMADEDLDVDQVASHMNMSRSKFFTLWKSLTSTPPHRFIHILRMEKARELLESGRYAVNMLPEMVGLKDEKHFRTIYKKYFRKTPAESIKYGQYAIREREKKVFFN